MNIKLLNEDYRDILQALVEENVKIRITALTGLKFEDTYRNSILVNIDGIEIHIPSIDDLIINKKATGRTKDLAGAAGLLHLMLLNAHPCGNGVAWNSTEKKY